MHLRSPPSPSATPHQDKGYQETPYSTAAYTVQPWCWLVRQALRSPLTCIPVPNSAPMAVLRWLSSPHGLHEQAKKQQGIPASCVHVASSSALCGGECGRVLCNPQSTRTGWHNPLATVPTIPSIQEYLEFRKERSKMLLSRRNQLLLEFSFWNEPQPRAGPNIYELRTYKLKVPGF